jgi:hypothetical protein
MIHGDDFDGAGADAEEAGESAGEGHEAEAGGDALRYVVLMGSWGSGEGALEFEAEGERVGCPVDNFVLLFERGIGRVKEDEPEDESDGVRGDAGGEPCAEERAEGGGDFEKHADADIGESFADIGGGGSRGSGNHGDERGADGVMDVDVKEDGEDRDDDHAAAETAECAEEAGGDGAEEEDEGELEGGHARVQGTGNRVQPARRRLGRRLVRLENCYGVGRESEDGVEVNVCGGGEGDG